MTGGGTSPILWPLAELLRAYSGRSLSPVEVTREALDRIDARDAELNAYVWLTGDAALAQARSAERDYARGETRPLLGVPISIKDLFDVAGARSAYGSRAYLENFPATDSPPVARLRDAGAVFLGKTNTAEFGQSATTETLVAPPAANPWNPARTAGGSSGGAAASVAAGLASAGLGSDGGGSIRIPAAFCGLFGLKPTHGAVPAGGGFRAMDEFSCSGPLARRVADARLLWEVLSGTRASSPTAPARLRIAWFPTLEERPVDAEVSRLAEKAVEVLLRLGPHESVELPPPISGWRETFRTLVLAEEWRERSGLWRQSGLELTDYVRKAVEAGERVTAREVDEARTGLARMRSAYDDYFQRVDLIVTPATAVPAFPIVERPRTIAGTKVDWLWGAFPFTPQFNVAGVPAASVPVGLAGGLPVGLQLVAPRGRESVLLDVCESLEEAIGFDAARPARAETVA